MKILVIRLSSIGDIILTEPVIRHLRVAYPQCRIDYVTKEQFVSLVKLFKGIDNVIPYTNHSETVRTVKKSILISKETEGYDLIIDLHNKPKTVLLRYSLPAKKRVSYTKHHLLRLLTVKRIKKTNIESTVLLYFNVFRKIGTEINENDFYPRLHLSLTDDSTGKTLTDELKKDRVKLIALFPGANHKTKRYPVELFARFINELKEKTQYLFIIMGSGEDIKIAEKLIDLCYTKPLNWCGRFDIAQLAEVLNFVDYVITNDSGPMHLAAALRKKQIAIFGATHPCLGFRPLNDKAYVLKSDLPCQPCSLHGGEKCPRKHLNCLNSISPELLKQALLSLEKDV